MRGRCLSRSMLSTASAAPEEPSAPEAAPTEDTDGVRIVAIFVVFFAGLAGGLLPVFLNVGTFSMRCVSRRPQRHGFRKHPPPAPRRCWQCFRNAAHPATLLLRALAAGVILSLALIHVIPDGMTDLGELSHYSYAPVCIVIGVLIMVVMEGISRSLLSDMQAARSGGGGGSGGAAGAGGGDVTTDTSKSSHPPALAPESWLRVDGLLGPGPRPGAVGPVGPVYVALEAPQHAARTAAPTAAAAQSSDRERNRAAAPASGQGAGGVDPGGAIVRLHTHTHTHTCTTITSVANWASNLQGLTVRNQVMAYMFELACVVHSILIGVALGVTVGNRGQAISLTAALVFHQGLEGLGLGSAIVKAAFTTSKSVAMVATYALMTPLGTAIGMAVAGTYDPESPTALGVQGTLNSISGGLLLYIALVQLVAEDFTRADLQQASGLVQVAMHVALVLGAASMAVIGIWN